MKKKKKTEKGQGSGRSGGARRSNVDPPSPTGPTVGDMRQELDKLQAKIDELRGGLEPYDDDDPLPDPVTNYEKPLVSAANVGGACGNRA
jgi:hypothetical protein